MRRGKLAFISLQTYWNLSWTSRAMVSGIAWIKKGSSQLNYVKFRDTKLVCFVLLHSRRTQSYSEYLQTRSSPFKVSWNLNCASSKDEGLFKIFNFTLGDNARLATNACFQIWKHWVCYRLLQCFVCIQRKKPHRTLSDIFVSFSSIVLQELAITNWRTVKNIRAQPKPLLDLDFAWNHLCNLSLGPRCVLVSFSMISTHKVTQSFLQARNNPFIARW